ncbi:AAA-ATPase At2g46620-like [Cucurbita maxima]|uniref:AAA-ATPase At2g46620-like n=1 Tax=Cucurbita maxima TaxID=3661 RepID=A0A6J1IA02_CUCMA|nr:AAA-ATPase At2g46620-like [Cucurbita maxima]
MPVFSTAVASSFFFAIAFVLVLRFIAKTSLLYMVVKGFQSITDYFHAYQYYRIPQFDENLQPNQLYLRVHAYLHSLPSLEDSNFTNLFCGAKPSDIVLRLDSDLTVHDSFLGAKLRWKLEMHSDHHRQNSSFSFVLKLRKDDKRRVFRQYFQHILSISDEIEQQKREIKMYITADGCARRWMAVPFTHPATFGTVVMDIDLKNKVKSDLEQFLRSKQYYHRLGRVWKRSFLLYGQPGTGKSSFVAAMAKFLQYDIYSIDMSKISSDSDMTILLLQTTPKSLILVEDLDRHLMKRSTATSASGVLNFMDGIASYCGEERVVVFTMTDKSGIDQAALRPGRVDVHLHFPACDFSAFKTLAISHLGVKDHKLFSQVEEVFQSGTSMSPAEIGEIMIANRSSPSRALKSIITALQIYSGDGDGRDRNGLKWTGGGSAIHDEDEIGSRRFFFKDNLSMGKLYGLLKLGLRKNEECLDSHSMEKN